MSRVKTFVSITMYVCYKRKTPYHIHLRYELFFSENNCDDLAKHLFPVHQETSWLQPEVKLVTFFKFIGLTTIWCLFLSYLLLVSLVSRLGLSSAHVP